MQIDETKEQMLIDFAHDIREWRNTDDVVMGGISQSRFHVVNEVAVFEGNVSLENHGGFASARTEIQGCDLVEYEGILLRIRGDGKHYGVRLRSSTVRGGFGYEARFTGIPDEWTDVQLPFKQFRPIFKGREAPEYGPLDPGKAEVIGFIVSGRQAGPFRLEIKHIKVYKEPRKISNPEPPPDRQ